MLGVRLDVLALDSVAADCVLLLWLLGLLGVLVLELLSVEELLLELV